MSPHSKSGSRGRSPHQILADKCQRLNEKFNHWIVHRTPFVIVKAAMTLDGKIATASGESKWITSEAARAFAMKLRQGADAILVGINTILADDPSLTVRTKGTGKPVRRIVLDSMARTPLKAKVVSDKQAALTTIVVSKSAPKNRVAALAKRVNVLVAPIQKVGRASSRAGASEPRPTTSLIHAGCSKSSAPKTSPVCWSKAAARSTRHFCSADWPNASRFSTRRKSWGDAIRARPSLEGVPGVWRRRFNFATLNGSGSGRIFC